MKYIKQQVEQKKYNKSFFKLFFLVPIITWTLFSLIVLIPDETDPDPLSVWDLVFVDTFCAIVWFLISLITYSIYKKISQKKIIKQESKFNVQTIEEEKTNEVNNKEIFNKRNEKVICSCDSHLTGDEYKKMAHLFPFIYKQYVKHGTFITIIFTFLFAIKYHTISTIFIFFTIMELFMLILYKTQLGNLQKKSFLKNLEKNPDIDISFTINFYNDYIEMVGIYNIYKILNNKIINKVETETNIYLQSIDNRVLVIDKENCPKEALNYIKEKYNIQNENKDKLFRKLVILMLLILFCFFVIKYFDNQTYDNYYHIEDYVNDNYGELEKIANNYINNKNTKKPKNIIDISVHRPNENYVNNDNSTVEFYMYGTGIVPSSHYYGFYYSKNDIPSCFQNGDCNLNEYEKNKWSWKGTGDNRGKTIKIREYWFYYEAHF